MLKKRLILECRTNIGSGEEFQICEEGLRPSHRHKAQLAILRNIPEKKQSSIYDASGKKIKTIVVPLRDETEFFKEMSEGFEKKKTEIDLNLIKQISIDDLADCSNIEAFCKYQHICSSILLEQKRLHMPSEQLHDFSENVFQNLTSNRDVEEIPLEELSSSDLIETLIRNSH